MPAGVLYAPTIRTMKMKHDNDITNLSNSPAFSTVLNQAISRRKVLGGGLAFASAGFFGGVGVSSAAAFGWQRKQRTLIGFRSVVEADGKGATPAISSDYEFQILIPWGEALQPGGPGFNHPPLAKEQTQQIGIGHDGMHFFPVAHGKFKRGGNEHGVLAINHEYGRNAHVLGKKHPESLEDVRVSQHAHGVSVVEIKKSEGQWQVIESEHARRIHVNTPVTFSGPVAGHALLQTLKGNAPLGTLNNCSNGHTPWGTYLTCEENINGYFGASNQQQTWQPTAAQKRYGFSQSGFDYGWHQFDARFDLSNPAYKNEENRFGWIVEIDPFDKKQTPVKRTALGRFKHEGIALTVGRDGRVVGYMGDDQRHDYIYKFVSDDNWQAMRARGQNPLDFGKLYVARFNADYTGEWLALTIENPTLAAHFADQAEILTFARLAADLLGATPMDRPEWTTVAPNGDVYCSLTNNTKRSRKNAANPIAPNPDGHIIRWRDADEHVGLQFEWDVFLFAKDSHGTDHSYGSPDGIWADPDGRLFIQTDGDQQAGLNNQMLVADTNTGEVRRLFTGVPGAEITGITVTPDRRTMFINVQHPGEGDPSKTNFPADFDGKTIPRDATVVITRKDGGVVGS